MRACPRFVYNVDSVRTAGGPSWQRSRDSPRTVAVDAHGPSGETTVEQELDKSSAQAAHREENSSKKA